MRYPARVFWAAGVEFKKFLSAKNLILMLFSLIFLGESVVRKMADVSALTGMRLNVLEPVNLILSHSFHAMVIPIAFIVLLSDFPDQSSGGIFMMVRMHRKGWLFGQLVYAVMTGMFYLLFLTVGSMFWLKGTGVFSWQWSPFMTEMSAEFPEIYGENIHLFLASETVTQGKPAGVWLVSCLLMLLYLLTLAQLLCMFKLIRWKRFGLFFCIALTVAGAVAVMYLDRLKWLFPMANSIFGLHFHEFYAEPVYRISRSVWYYVVLNLILILINLRISGKCHVGDDSE